MKIVLILFALLSIAVPLQADEPIRIAKMNPYVAGAVSAAAPAGATITDNFSSDTSANYTGVLNGITVTGGAAYGSTNWAGNIVYHETDLGSPDHYVQAITTGIYQGVVARYNPTNQTGYMATMTTAGTYVKLYAITSNAVGAELQTGDVTGATSPYTLRIVTNGSTDIKVYVNESLAITYNTPAYTTGNYCGLFWGREGGTNYGTDDLEAD